MSALMLARAPFAANPSPTANTALGALRGQAAYLRTLLDELERLTSASSREHGLSEQIVEELARLGCRSLEAASELTLVIADSRRSA